MKDRQKLLLTTLKDRNFLTINDLAKVMHYSASTIRRDLKELENNGLVQRIHGGALVLKPNEIETPTTIKQHLNLNEKKYIAALASGYVENRQSIFLDSSSTANVLAKSLDAFNDLNITTTNLETATYLSLHTQNKVNIMGGNVRDTYSSGMLTARNLKNYVFDISFISCRGFSLKYGVTDKVESESSLKHTLTECTKKLVLLIDSNKMGLIFPYRDCELSQIFAVVTDKKPDKKYNKIFEKNNVEVVY